MSKKSNVLVVTIGHEQLYEDGLNALQTLKDGGTIEEPATVSFANERQLNDVFNDRTYRLLRVIQTEEPQSIRETARLVERDVKNVHEELTTLEALGVIRFEENGGSKRPVFPYSDLVISPLAHEESDAEHRANA